MIANDITMLDAFFKKRFKLNDIKVSARSETEDSAEVCIGEEFIGIVYRDEEEGELSWNFQMAILEVDVKG